MDKPLFTRREFLASSATGLAVSSGCLSLPINGGSADNTAVQMVYVFNTDDISHEYTAQIQHEGETFFEETGTVEASKDGVGGSTIIVESPKHQSNIDVKCSIDGIEHWVKMDTSQINRECAVLEYKIYRDGGLDLYIQECRDRTTKSN